MNYSHLMSPGAIGGLELRNRILMTPMGSNLAETNGHCGDRIQTYYEARARGGAGAVIVGVGAIAWPEGSCNPNQVAVSSDEFLPGLSALAERVKQHGCRAAIQLQHAGKVAVCDIAAGRPMLVPSLPSASKDEMMYALTPEEIGAFVKSYTKDGAKIEYKVATAEDIQWLIDKFAEAAERAQRAGFEAVELHAGHGYIISEFLSPHVNKREDEYGGSLENRARLLVEVIRAVKQRCGAGFPVWCRIDSKEFRVDDGIVFEDAIQTAGIAEQAGADAIHVSAYADPASGVGFTEAPLVHEVGGFLTFAAGIKKNVSIPVIAVGRIEPDVADKVIAAGEADFVAMGRKLLADPDLPNKLSQGRPADVRPCIYCYVCVSQIFLNKHVMCAVNAQTGHELDTLVLPAENPRSVVIVGGGPAGMETARVAAQRGHRVSLFEASGRLGGTVFFSSIAYPPNLRLIQYLEKQVRELPIDIQLNSRLQAADITALDADVVVVATGALRNAPPIPGADQAHVYSGDELRNLMTGEDAEVARQKLGWFDRLMMFFGSLLGITRSTALIRALGHLWMPVGKKVAVVGGGLVGVELAEFLAERGRQVTVIEEGEKFGVELSVVRRWRLLHELRELGVIMINKAQVARIDSHSLHLLLEDGDVDIDADTVILASGAESNRSLADELEGQLEIHVVGDCGGVGYIEGAMHSGNRVGRSI